MHVRSALAWLIVNCRADSMQHTVLLLPCHGIPFQGQSPGNHGDILRQAHRAQHFWPEHAGVADFDPLAQLL